MTSNHDQNNELSVLMVMMEVYLLILLKIFNEVSVQLEYCDCLVFE